MSISRISRFLSLSLACALLLLACASAAPLSPALDLLAADAGMVKSGTTAGGVTFCAADFTNALSLNRLEAITVTSLPDPTLGALYLGSVPVAVNQTISAVNLDKLRFAPNAGVETAVFQFRAEEEYSLACLMRIENTVNYAPTADAFADTVTARTQKDITCFGTLGAYDPEGDALVYEITDYPLKGLITLTDAAHGDFRYTPYVGCSGRDTFSYRVRDSRGNYSAPVSVRIEIARKNARLVFSDMSEHWAHSAAIEMAAAGIMDYDWKNDLPVFCPDETVSREDFLVMILKTLRVEDPGAVIRTSFDDNDDIAPEKRGYVEAAYRAGIIRGVEEDGARRFLPKAPISRAETAVMLNNLIGAEVPLHVALYTDNDAIPAWAQSALYALTDIGILRGTGSGEIAPQSPITRAQAAQILSNLRVYVG